MSQIYRYKLSSHIIAEITQFAKIHQHDDRNAYKEAWSQWCDENSRLIFVERERLYDLGYKGSVTDKMYKAGRYYFRTKNTVNNIKPRQRRPYIYIDTDFIKTMDDHIQAHMHDKEYTPATGLDLYNLEYQNIINDNMRKLLQTGLSNQDILLKIKKTYKNRYYLLSK